MLKVKVPSLIKKNMVSEQLQDFMNTVKQLDPLSELKNDMSEFLSEIDITERKEESNTNTNTQGVLIDNQRLSTQGVLIDNQTLSTKKESKTKGDLMNDLINGIVNSTM
jgi:hypothetical protein